MPANSVHHCLSGCCYIPSVNNFFWEGNKISWNWTLNLDFCHSYAWDPSPEPSLSMQTAGLLWLWSSWLLWDEPVNAILLTNTKFLLARFGRPDPEWWRQPRVCVNPLHAFEEFSASTTHQQAPFVWKFQRGGGAGFAVQPGWLSFLHLFFALCFWSCISFTCQHRFSTGQEQISLLNY